MVMCCSQYSPASFSKKRREKAQVPKKTLRLNFRIVNQRTKRYAHNELVFFALNLFSMSVLSHVLWPRFCAISNVICWLINRGFHSAFMAITVAPF